MTRKKILVVPFWVRDSLWRSGHKIEDLLLFESAREILSRNELAILHVMQSPNIAELVFGASTGAYGVNLPDIWYENIRPDQKTHLDQLLKHMSEVQCDDEIKARLFDNSNVDGRDNTNVVVEVPGFGVAVTVFPGTYIGENKTTNNAALSHEVAKLLYKYECMSNLLHSPFFAKHIETLSR